MNISCFKNVRNPRPEGNISIDRFLQAIRDGRWMSAAVSFRAMDKEEQNKAKMTVLPCVTISGTFDYRKVAGLKDYSSLACIDLDDIESERFLLLRKEIEADKYTFACFSSISGTGLAILVRLSASPDSHSECYGAMIHYYENKYNFKTDIQCRDVSRLRFISYDPSLYYNSEAHAYEISQQVLSEEQKAAMLKVGVDAVAQAKIEAEPATAPGGHRFDEAIPANISQYQSQIAQGIEQAKDGLPNKKGLLQVDFGSIYSNKDILDLVDHIYINKIILGKDEYDAWLHLAFAFVSEFGETGREYFHKISASSTLYKPEECDKKYTHCLGSTANKITIGTFFFYAKEAGIRVNAFIDKNNGLIVHAAVCGKDSPEGKASVDSVVKALGIHGIEDKACRDLVQKVYERDVAPSDQSKIGGTERAINLVRLHYPNMRHNTILGCVECDDRLMDDNFFNTIYVNLSKADKKVTKTNLDTVIHSDHMPDYNPIKNFYETHINDPYDPKFGLLQKLADSIESDTGQYIDNDGIDQFDKTIKMEMVMKWLCGVPNTVYVHHSPLMLILTGPSGCGKTEWFRRLWPKEFSTYYCETKLDDKKDSEIALCENLIIMDDECSGKTMREANLLKVLTSKQTFHVRRPYDKYARKMRRLALMAATSNYDKVITDMTCDNRRVLPIRVTSVNFDLYNSIDKTALAMEVYHLWQSGYEWQILGDAIDRLTKITDKHVAEDDVSCLIEKYFEDNSGVKYKQKGTHGALHMTATEINEYIANRTPLKITLIAAKTGRSLKKMKYVSVVKRRGERVMYGYWMVKAMNFD
jgi:hypothetical protein